MGEADRGQYDAIEEVFGPSAGAALYRRKMLEEVGLFDEDFFAYMEDVDLAFRGQLAGWNASTYRGLLSTTSKAELPGLGRIFRSTMVTETSSGMR